MTHLVLTVTVLHNYIAKSQSEHTTLSQIYLYDQQPKMSSLDIRYAREAELPGIVQLMITAFRGRAMNDAFFPEHLKRINDGDSDELEFRTRNISRSFGSENRHHVVAVDEQDQVLGYAEWADGLDDTVVDDMTPEERDSKKAEGIKRLPKSFDLNAAEKAMREMEPLSDKLREVLGREGYANSWSRSHLIRVHVTI